MTYSGDGINLNKLTTPFYLLRVYQSEQTVIDTT